MATFHATFSESGNFTARFAESNSFDAAFGEVQYIQVADWYEGDYEVTPSEEPQIIPIEGKTAEQNIVIGAIPNNYGLITWDGTTLTVS